MNDLDTLYRQVIMDHYKNPRNKGLMDKAPYIKFHIKNASCGDDITVEALIENGIIKEVRHEGKGCSICCSSASIMSEIMQDKSINEALVMIQAYFKLVKGEEIDVDVDLEDAVVYKGVKDFPARIKCASLAWLALEELINGENNE